MKAGIIDRIINIIAPARCPICGNRLSVGESLICGRCNLRLPRTHYERAPYDNYMAKLFYGRIRFEKCSALFHYSPSAESTGVILDMKYRHHPEYGVKLGMLAASDIKASGFFDGMTAVMPLPLARNRERQRGYNQSREIAKGISIITGLPVIDKAIKRQKFVDSQTHKTYWERSENVRGVFSLIDGSKLEGQHVLVVDDVCTTGSTLCSCISAMEEVKNLKVSIFTIGLAGR